MRQVKRAAAARARLALVMRALTILLAAAFALAPPARAAGGDAVAFYPQAQAWAQARHDIRELRIACTRRSGDVYVTLLADGSGKTVLAAFSGAAPRDAASLFTGAGATRDWAWIWDRNGDGAADYLAFYLGTELVVRELPPDFPRGKSPKLSAAQLDFVLHHMRQTFYHAADDNFDGRADVAIYPLRDAETWLWVKGGFVLRSTHFDGRVDEDWAFAERPAERAGPAPRSERGYRVRIDPAEGETGEKVLESWSDWFARINGAAKTCGAEHPIRGG